MININKARRRHNYNLIVQNCLLPISTLANIPVSPKLGPKIGAENWCWLQPSAFFTRQRGLSSDYKPVNTLVNQ